MTREFVSLPLRQNSGNRNRINAPGHLDYGKKHTDEADLTLRKRSVADKAVGHEIFRPHNFDGGNSGYEPKRS